jgi:hypothetical protein
LTKVDNEEVWKECTNYVVRQVAQSVLVSRSKANGVTLDEWPGMTLSQVCFGVDDLKESKGVFVDVDSAEFSNLNGCVSNKPQEISAEVGMNFGGIDVGKVVGARGNSYQGGDGASTNTSKDIVKVFVGRRL